MILKIEAQSRLNQYTDVTIGLEPDMNQLRRWTKLCSVSYLMVSIVLKALDRVGYPTYLPMNHHYKNQRE